MTIPDMEVLDGIVQPKRVDLPDGKYEAKFNHIDLRTQAQNSALWLWLAQIATQFNRDNITMDMVLKMDTKWNKNKVKVNTLDELVKKQFGKNSTTKLSKDEFSFLIELMFAMFAFKGVTLPKFPSIEIKDKT